MVPSFTFIFPLYRGGQVLLIEESGKSGKNHDLPQYKIIDYVFVIKLRENK
jgi:hypothetical protein